MRVSHTFLKVLAAITWYVGGVMLLLKGGSYLAGAARTGAVAPPVVAAVLGVSVGVLRGRTMFLRACRRNLARIDALERPRVWQFFRPVFFAALVLMIGGGAALSRLADAGYWTAVVVGGLELVISTALLSSSTPFWGWSGSPSTSAYAGDRPSDAQVG